MAEITRLRPDHITVKSLLVELMEHADCIESIVVVTLHRNEEEESTVEYSWSGGSSSFLALASVVLQGATLTTLGDVYES